MKLYQLLMIALLTSSVFCGSVAAEYQDDKLFGNGRFLRRLRNETAKKPQPKSKDAKKPSKKTQADPGARQPTPAGKRPSGKVPTPAVRTNKTTPARPTEARKSVSSTLASVLGLKSKEKAKPKEKTKPKAITKPIEKPSQPKHSSKSTREGFGMELEMKSEDFTVTKVDSRGNAHEAGIKKGDVIVQAGGVDLGSSEEFDEITKILGAGDQLEFKIQRRGKKKDLMIQFGETPEEGEVVKSSETKNENDFSFASDRDDNSQTGLRSVVDRPLQNVNKSAADLGQSNSQQTIERQRRQIKQMQQEIESLKRRSRFVPANTSSRIRKSSNGPSLTGPEK